MDGVESKLATRGAMQFVEGGEVCKHSMKVSSSAMQIKKEGERALNAVQMMTEDKKIAPTYPAPKQTDRETKRIALALCYCSRACSALYSSARGECDA